MELYLFVIGDLENAYAIEEICATEEEATKEIQEYYEDEEIIHHLDDDETMAVLKIEPGSIQTLKTWQKGYCPRGDERKRNGGFDVQSLCKECSNNWLCEASTARKGIDY